MRTVSKRSKTCTPKNKKNYILLAPLKWVGTNIILPFLPIVVKMFTNFFSTSEVNIWELNDLLYYNFFICLLLLDLLKSKDTYITYLLSLVIKGICLVDILVIAFNSTGQQNLETTQPFAIAVAIICACFGSAYVLIQASIEEREETSNE